MDAQGTLNPPRASVDILSRSAALVAVAHHAGLLDRIWQDHDVDRWSRTLPESLRPEFGPALNEFRIRPVETIERYRSGNLSSNSLPDALGKCLLDELDTRTQKRTGSTFTPRSLAAQVAHTALRHWRRLHRSGTNPRTIIDLSCGPGVFLSACQSLFQEGTTICGADKRPLAVAYARLLCWSQNADWRLGCQDSLLAMPPSSSLFSEESSVFRGIPMDILIGNPPFIRSPLLNPLYCDEIRSAYPSTRDGNFDLSIAFIEHAIDSLAEGGPCLLHPDKQIHDLGIRTPHLQASCKRCSGA